MNKKKSKPKKLSVNFKKARAHVNLSRALLLLLLCVSVFKASSQEINLIKQNVSLESILKDIEKQGNYAFLYKKGEIADVKSMSVNIRGASVEQAIKTLLSNLRGFEYEFFDNLVVIKKLEQSKNASSYDSFIEQQYKKQARFNIIGKVFDGKRTPLRRILIEEVGTEHYTYSDQNGNFLINVSESGTLQFSGRQKEERSISYSLKRDTSMNVMLGEKPIELLGIDVEANNPEKNPTRFVDLKNKSYMSLGQVLQGTVPGLSLQTVNTTSVTPTAIDVPIQYSSGGTPGSHDYYRKSVRMTIDEYLTYEGQVRGQEIIDQLLKGKQIPGYTLYSTTNVSNNLVPQIRGASNFSGNISGMLVVIDGFPQESFPADYPMVNVESIEVVKDAKELAKWGTKASGGAIFIKTKNAKNGKIKVNYSSNFYYYKTPRYQRSELGLASSKDYLNYLLDVDSMASLEVFPNSINTDLARRLLSLRKTEAISEDQFNTSWDSLSMIDNSQQLQELQQDAFRQNHSLNLTGGVKSYQFSFLGSFSDERGANINSKQNSVNLSLNNKIDLLNNKLKIDWLLDYSNTNSRSSKTFSFTNPGVVPYQMLLDDNGNYLYDYNVLSENSNRMIEGMGYYNHGVNILEDARLNYQDSKTMQARSRFNMNWDLLPGLKWGTSIFFNQSDIKGEAFKDRRSSEVRQLLNDYGEYTENGVNFRVPYGDIYSRSRSKASQLNVRTGLSYNKTLGEKHEIEASVGVGGSEQKRRRPAFPTLYGYNPKTGLGSPIFVDAANPAAGVSNYNKILNASYETYTGGKDMVYPQSLLTYNMGDTTNSKNLNLNLGGHYSFAKRLKISGSYVGIYEPTYGETNAIYSKTQNFLADVQGKIVKGYGRMKADVSLSTGIWEHKMPDMAAVYQNKRYLQNTWDNYGMWVNGLTPVQQQGQASRNIYQKLFVDLFEEKVRFNISYNTQRIRGSFPFLKNGVTVNRDSVTTLHYLGAKVEGSLRNHLLNFAAEYSKSPEGTDQWNAYFDYNIASESYFKSTLISSLGVDGRIQMISPFQAMGLMMSTNVNNGGNFSNAINSDFSELPPENVNYEAHAFIGLVNDRYTLDLRYYNQSTSGLDNLISVAADPSTGVGNKVTYSTLVNKGVEFYLKTGIINKPKFGYTVILNGAYNRNIAKQVPTTLFTSTRSYATASRSGYDVSNIWSVPWAGLDKNGDPQIYDNNGVATSTLDSATIASSLLFSGVTTPPWTGGFIHELRYGSVFARASLTFNLGHVMRMYRPIVGNYNEDHALIASRWRKAGDEAFTDIPRISKEDASSFRTFVVQNGTNSIVSADNIRLQDVMLGVALPASFYKKLGLDSFTVTVQAQNLAVWTRKGLDADPQSYASNGRMGMPLSKIYSCSINLSF